MQLSRLSRRIRRACSTLFRFTRGLQRFCISLLSILIVLSRVVDAVLMLLRGTSSV